MYVVFNLCSERIMFLFGFYVFISKWFCYFTFQIIFTQINENKCVIILFVHLFHFGNFFSLSVLYFEINVSFFTLFALLPWFFFHFYTEFHSKCIQRFNLSSIIFNSSLYKCLDSSVIYFLLYLQRNCFSHSHSTMRLYELCFLLVFHLIIEWNTTKWC